MAKTYEVISCDGHLETVPIFKYVPDKYRDIAPRLVNMPNGGQAWIAEGQSILENTRIISAGRTPVKLTGGSYWEPDGKPVPGTGGPIQRLHELDQDGVDAEVLNPPIHVTALLMGMKDREVTKALIHAYNIWLAEYCSVAPDRLIGLGRIPTTGIDDAVDELKHCAELGLKAVTLHQFPGGAGIGKPEDDRFWEKALELRMGISPHGGLGDRSGSDSSGRANFAVHLCFNTHAGCMIGIANLITAGVFDRFPQLRIHFAEVHAGWLPEAIQWVDDNWTFWQESFPETRLKMAPSEYMRKNILFNIIRDPIALKLRDYYPVENLTWGTDLPHTITSWPNSRKWLNIIFDGVPAELRKKILVDNPVEYFHLDATKPLTPTPGKDALEREQDSLGPDKIFGSLYGRTTNGHAAKETAAAGSR